MYIAGKACPIVVFHHFENTSLIIAPRGSECENSLQEIMACVCFSNVEIDL